MSTFRFVHASDLRLDTPFEGIGRVAPAAAEVVRDASLGAWDALVDLAIDREAAFVLLAGNSYDGPSRGVRAQLRFLRGVERLDRHGIQTVAVYGPFDPHAGWPAIRQWPDSTAIFGSEAVTSVRIERGGAGLATVHGVSFKGPDVLDNLALGFKRGEEPGIHVGLLSCTVGADQGKAPPASPCSLDDLLNASMDYWALGGSPRHQILCEKPCWIAYSGMLQGRGPEPDDRGPKGALVVEVENDSIAHVTFEPLDRVRILEFETDVSAVDDPAALRKLLMQKMNELKAENRDRALLVRAVLQGNGGIHAALKRPDCLAEVVRDLREEAEDESPIVWWEALIDKTRPEINRDTIRRRNDFSAELLRQTETLRKDPAALAALLEEQTTLLNRLAVRRVLENPTAAELEELLGHAEDLALDALEGAQEP
jgi:DNA repair protein SbcD/Mre11